MNECVDDLLVKKSKAAYEQHAAALANAKKLADAHGNEGGASNGMPEKSLKERRRQCEAVKSAIPRVVIRHKAKGAKQAQKRLRKNTIQNKVLTMEFNKNPVWSRKKIQ